MSKLSDIILLELFSGIGGFAKGIEEAGLNIKKHYFSEVDVHAIANYKYNFKNAEYVGSVKDVSHTNIERPDIITFGSPCQDFSIAGKGAGMGGQRSVLILEAIRLIIETRPSAFIWENVAGAISRKHRKDFWAIINAFANIGGYRLEWQLLNTKWFPPQNRERIYLVGHLAGRSKPGIFPIEESFNIYNGNDPREKPRIANCLDANYFKGWLDHGARTHIIVNNKGESQSNRIYETTGISPTLNSGSKISGNQSPKIMYKDWDTSQDNRVHLSEGIAPCLGTSTGASHPKIEHKELIRRLTEIECERLQGFQDNWTRYGNYNGTTKEISKTQRYKMCGNAVSVPVVKAIAERIEIISS